jgi:hypothetical protein
METPSIEHFHLFNKNEQDIFMSHIKDKVIKNLQLYRQHFSDDKLNEFIKFYDKIEQEDMVAPLFSKTKKFDQMKFNFKQHPNKDQKRYNKLSRSLNAWKPTDEHSFSKMLKSILNKLNESNFEILFNEFIENLKEVKTPIIDDLIENFIIKSTVDDEFNDLYFKFLSKLNSDEYFYNIFCSIIEDKKYFYYISKTERSNTIYGKFKSQKKAQDYCRKRYDLFKYLAVKCEEKFKKNDELFEKINQEEDKEKILKIRRTISGIVRIFGESFNLGYLDEKIIHFIFIFCLNLNEKSTNKNNEEKVEMIYVLMNTIMKNNKKLDLKCLELYKNKLIDVEKNIGSRYKFLISEIIVLINKKLNKKQEHKYIFDYNYLINKLDSNKNKFNNYLYDKFLFKLKEIEKDLNSNNFIKNYKCFLDNLLIDCFEIKIKNERLEWYKLFKELTKIIVEHKIIYEEVINEITEYIDDITLDIPDIIDKLKEFNEFKIY